MGMWAGDRKQGIIKAWPYAGVINCHKARPILVHGSDGSIFLAFERKKN